MDGKTAPKQKYHHGALREALLDAAEAEIAEAGLESFSLRRVAKRAGVSHAAPAHHFGDAGGLLTALAARGYRRFVETQRAREKLADPDPREQLLASGLGYVDFALANPALFRLMFSSRRPDYTDANLGAAANAAFEHLCGHVEAIKGVSPFQDPAGMLDAVAAWTATHGVADLLVSGQLFRLPEADREQAVADIIRRSLPDPVS